MLRIFTSLLVLFSLAVGVKAHAQSVGDVTGAASTCKGDFVNPITDICWSCIFPLSVGGLKIWPSSRPDPKNPTSPICACGTPIPRIGIAVGFWEAARLVDVSPKPWCFVNLGGLKLDPGFPIGGGAQRSSDANSSGKSGFAKYHAHWYIYPVLAWLEILTDFACMETTSFDLAYMTELDPLWQDDGLSSIINPEAVLFSNPIAVAACAADCVASTASLPVDPLFWCAGCQGHMYPFNGNVSHFKEPIQASRLVATRLAFKLHRQGLAWGTAGKKALCKKYIMPVMRKQQYRMQAVNPVALTKGRYACPPIGVSTNLPKTGRSYPVGGEDYGYLMWRKRNCCLTGPI